MGVVKPIIKMPFNYPLGSAVLQSRRLISKSTTQLSSAGAPYRDRIPKRTSHNVIIGSSICCSHLLSGVLLPKGEMNFSPLQTLCVWDKPDGFCLAAPTSALATAEKRNYVCSGRLADVFNAHISAIERAPLLQLI